MKRLPFAARWELRALRVLRALRALVVLVATFAARPAFAAPTDEATTAEALFVAGREAVERGDYATACPKFAESDRLDPAAGTRINLADCEEHLGQLASAWRHWHEALEALGAGDGRTPLVKERVAALDRRVPRLTITLGHGFDTARGARVVRDDVEVGLASLSVPLPVDPGPHRVEVTAPDHEPTRKDVTLLEGQSVVLVVDVGAEKPRASSPTGAAASPFPFRPVGWASVVVGGASVAASLVLGAFVLHDKSVVSQNCYPANVCNDQGADAAADGRTLGIASTATAIAGVTLVGLGVTLVVMHPSSAGAVQMQAGAQGFSVGGRF